MLDLDAHTCTKEDVTTITSPFTCTITRASTLNAFAGWFDAQFNGSDDDPAPNPIELSTAPSMATHWAQQVFFVHPPIEALAEDTLDGVVHLTRQKVNHRLLWVQVRFSLHRPGAGQVGAERCLNFRID